MKDNANPWQEAWEELEEIGRGGQGIITELRHKTDSRRRAVLKRIVPRWRQDLQARQRLHQEAETLMKLHELGARVPAVYDSFLNHGASEPFLLMEFIEGVRFDEWLKTRAPVGPREAVLITRGIADTISLCHQHEIGHRDLKPSNIILKNGEISLAYILDFGIAFDSRQTMIFTREGEIFWNEFITLPECQDLEGGHRDLRSDITALAGIFFTCLTGRPPIVLRDAQELAPHQRHEALLLASAQTVEQGEHLIWLFDRAFAYPIAERFQTLDQFTAELVRFADSSTVEGLDLVEQFAMLDQAVRSTDRNVQVAALGKKYARVLDKVDHQMRNELDALKEHNGRTALQEVGIRNLPEPSRPKLNSGDLLNTRSVRAFIVGREHFQHSAVVLLAAFGVSMQIHLYSASYCAPSAQLYRPQKSPTWSKIAALDENHLSETKLSVIVEALKSKLAREIRNLVREKTG
ncbi:MAG: serine/threonine protein kinase [Planctomycetota bacterium]|jgi:serine/threonine-protein kinase